MIQVAFLKPGTLVKPHNGPSHMAMDDETGQFRCWYGQNPFELPVGPGVLIHCMMPTPLKLDIPFREYPTCHEA